MRVRAAGVYGGRRGEARGGQTCKRERGRRSERDAKPRRQVGRVADTPPATKHRLRQPTADSVRYSHANEGSEARDGPGRAVEQRDRHATSGAAAEVGEEAQRRATEGAVNAHRKHDEAHARQEHTVLVSSTARRDRSVSAEATAVGVITVDVSRRAGVKGLQVNQREGPQPIQSADHGIGPVREPSASALHELINGAPPAGPLGEDSRRAKERIEADN